MFDGKMDRREFVRKSAAATVSACVLGGVSAGASAAVGADGLDWKKAPCRYCGTGCGVLVGVKGGKIVATKGDPDCWSNKGLNCVKGYMLAKMLYGKGRLTSPMIRKNGKLEKVSWDEALDYVADKFKKTLQNEGSNGVAMWGSGQWTIFEGYVASKFMKGGLGFISKDGVGSNNLDPNARMCMASAVVAFMRSFSSDEPMGSYEDIEHADVFVTWGSNMAECHPVLYSRILARQMSGSGVKHIDLSTIKMRTSDHSDIFMSFKPQTDLVIANFFANYILENKLEDKAFIDQNLVFKKAKTDIGYGTEKDADVPADAGSSTPMTFEEYKEWLKPYTADYAAKMSGCKKEDLLAAAKLISDPAKKVVSYWTMGVNQHTRGVWMNHLIYNYHLLQGKISKPGSGPFSLTGQPSACGTAREVGTFSHRLPADMVVNNEDHRKKTAEVWKIPVEKINAVPGKHTIEMFRAFDRGEIKVLWSQVANPLQSLPNVKRFREAADRNNTCFIVSDIYETESTRHADVVLPSAGWVEKEGAFGNAERRTQHWDKIVDPPGEARDDAWQMFEVAKRLGIFDKLYASWGEKWHKAAWEEYRSFSLGIGKDLAPYDELRKAHGLVWPYVDGKETKWRYNSEFDPYAKKFAGEHGDRKGNVHFYKAKTMDYKAAIFACPYEPAAEEPDSAYPLWLCTGRVLEHWHTGTMTRAVPELLRAVPEALANLHPDDAKALGVKKGDMVKVSTRRGSMKIKAEVNGRSVPQKGMVFIAFFDDKKLVNNLTLDRYDPLSKEVDYKKCAAKVEKA